MFEKPISINYIKLQPYFGSYNGTSFALMKKEDKLEAYLYPYPFGFDATPDEKKLKGEFEFSDSGYEEAVAWMKDHMDDFKTAPHGMRYSLNSETKIDRRCVMGLFFKSKEENQLDLLIEKIKMNLSNNYKDTALQDVAKFEETLKFLVENKKIKDYKAEDYTEILDEFKEKLKGVSNSEQKPYWS